MRIVKSPNPLKKYRAIFDNGRHTDFGQHSADDYTKTHDKNQRQRYLTRHRANEDWTNPYKAGTLSKFILWGDSTDINVNIANYKKRFNL